MVKFAKPDCKIGKACRDFSQEHRFLWKPVLILSVIMMVSISAILLADYNYIDDVLRVNFGGRYFTTFGRYISEYLSIAIHADTYLTDVSPLTQILACCFVAASGAIVLHVITGKKEFTFWEYAAVLPLGLSPYFLQCLSYKFDSPYMAISILGSVAPLLWRNKDWKAYVAATVVGTLVMCTSYQASSGIFPLMVMVLCLKQWNEKEDFKQTLKFALISAGAYLVGLLIFRFGIYQASESYAGAETGEMGILMTMARNLIQYYSMVVFDFKASWNVLVLLVGVSFLLVSVIVSKRNKLAAFGLTVLVMLMMILLCFGAFAFIESTLFEPRAMYGFGAMLAIMAVYIVNSGVFKAARVFCFALSWVFVSFAFTYGNALEEQKEYTDFRITSVIEDLKDWDEFTAENQFRLRITGAAGYAPVNDKNYLENNVLVRLIPPVFIDTRVSMFSGLDMIYFYGFNNVSIDWQNNVEKEDLEVLTDNIYHTIWVGGDYIWVELKNYNENVGPYFDMLLPQ